MDLKIKIKAVLKKYYGSFDTHLENKYQEIIINNLIVGDLDRKKEWLTYNQVILELKYTIKDSLRVKELQYKLTEDNNPNKVCIEVIEAVKELTPELDRLYHKIKNF